MKKYFEYMDNVKVSDTLHQRLVELEAPKKRAPVWKKYGAAAAALVLVAGVGAYGLSRGGWDALTTNFHSLASLETAIEPVPDIAIVAPGDDVEPGPTTGGGYEIQEGELMSYYLLPYIEYGDTGGAAASLDWDVPKGAVKRDLTQADFAALFGKEENLSIHLDWGGYELTGWAAWYEDGSFWGSYLHGYAGPLDHFEFAFTAGHLPPTCIAFPGSVTQEVFGLTVTADKHDGEHGCDRRVSFMKDDYGYRFDITATSTEQASQLVSRLVRWVAIEGLELDAVTPDGTVLAHPWEADPGYGAGEPDYEDGVSDYDSDCPYCVDGTVHTHPHNPDETAETRSPGPNS